MPKLSIPCTVFDPIRFTTFTKVSQFIVDTWFSYGLITRTLYKSLPGLETDGVGKVEMSSGMYTEQPKTAIGIQIKNLRALPLTVYVIDDGPAPLLLGSDFLKLLFDIGQELPDPDVPHITVEPSRKRADETLGIRLIPETETVNALELERFLNGIRSIHNIAAIAKLSLHQHDDWPRQNVDNSPLDRKVKAVEQTIDCDRSLSNETRLSITWIESGSIWLSLFSSVKTGLSWLSQMIPKSIDARIQSSISNASTAEEQAAILKMTRKDIIDARIWEERRKSASNFRKAREEWHKTIMSEIDFKKKLAQEITDPVVREAVARKLNEALAELTQTSFLPIVEHLPNITADEQDLLPAQRLQ
ncbi:MAG TPA: hypothetical protein VFC63_25250 [Blastocatellia bacterium]|nr:hypothetical protein [Blastocatellia bacterium]